MAWIERERVAWLQGSFYVPSSLWPLLHMRSFEAVTGPKVDRWLVKTVAGLLSVVGVTLIGAARQHRVTPEMEAVAAGSAAVLATIDVVYVARKRISPVYLLDAVAQVTMIALWIRARSSH
jgi:hypothetical protein